MIQHQIVKNAVLSLRKKFWNWKHY